MTTDQDARVERAAKAIYDHDPKLNFAADVPPTRFLWDGIHPDFQNDYREKALAALTAADSTSREDDRVEAAAKRMYEAFPHCRDVGSAYTWDELPTNYGRNGVPGHMHLRSIAAGILAAADTTGDGLDALLKEIGAVTLSSTSGGVMATVRTVEDNYYQSFGNNSYDATRNAVAAVNSDRAGEGMGDE